MPVVNVLLLSIGRWNGFFFFFFLFGFIFWEGGGFFLFQRLIIYVSYRFNINQAYRSQEMFGISERQE